MTKIIIVVIDIINYYYYLFHVIKYMHRPQSHLIIKTIIYEIRIINKTSIKNTNYELKSIWWFTKKIN